MNSTLRAFGWVGCGVVAWVGCGEAEDATPGSDTALAIDAGIPDGTPDAVGILALLNDASATLGLLDDDVGLDKRAAQALVAHRDGADQTFGTGDDDAFDGIAEADALPHVGPSAFTKLLAYAEANGFVPAGDDLLGLYDGVPFTVNEASATMDLVNEAPAAVLDDEVGLDKRAVESIVAARPLASVLAVSGLPYVGKSALTKLKVYAAQSLPGPPGSDCVEDVDCAGGLRCVGKPNDGSPEIGKCVDTEEVPGEDTECSVEEPCGPGLVCSGLTIPWNQGQGWCRAAWMAGTYVSDASVAIPNGGSGIMSPVVVYGLATVPEDIVANVDLDHPRPEDLIIRLHHSSGTFSVLWDHDPAAGGEVVVGPGIERDNYVNGTYQLEVVDTVAGQSGVLSGFSVWLTSRWD